MHEFGELNQIYTWIAAGGVGIAAAAVPLILNHIGNLRHEIGQCRESLGCLQEGFYRSSLDGRQLHANPALIRLNGYRSEKEMLQAVRDIDAEWYVKPGRRDEFKRLLFEKGRITGFISEVYRHKTRDRIWISENARLVTDPRTGDPLYYEGTVREISDEIHLNETRAMLQKLADNLPGGLFQIQRDREANIEVHYMSANFVDLMDLANVPTGELIAHISSRMDLDELRQYNEAFKQSALELKPLNQRVRYRKNDGRVIWIHVTATPERRDNGTIVWHGHTIDVTAQRENEERFERLANIDALTELPKRTVLEQQLKSTIAACNRRGEFAAVLFVDLDNFKQLNDSNGHEAGDELLRQTARRLKSQTRACDTVARYGGDEFVLLIDNLGTDRATAREKAAQIADKLLNSFEAPFRIGDLEHHGSPSIGIALIGSDLPKPEAVINRADAAMYQAKRAGRNTYVIHDENREGGSTAIHHLQAELKGAVKRGEFVLHFQPQLGRDGRICGAEALIRWNHPEHGCIPPSDFMPVAEKTGQVGEINDWVLATAIATLQEWQVHPVLGKIQVAINVSPQQLASPDFTSRLENELVASGINRARLTLEIAEGLLSRKPEAVGERMRKLQKSGVRLSLDDFGTGPTSLASLSQLPFDEVKIEGLLVTAIDKDEQSRTMVAGILGIARALKLDTVAEHVSSPLEHAYLSERGCDRYQGYHFHPPMPVNEFRDAVLRDYKHGRMPMAG